MKKIKIFSIVSAAAVFLISCSPGLRQSARRLAVSTAPGVNSPVGVTKNKILPHQDVACTLKSAGGSCDVIYTPAQGTATALKYSVYDASVMPISGRLCLKNGDYPFTNLELRNITGSPSKQAEVINCGGRVVLGNKIDNNADGVPDLSRGIAIANSTFFKMTGTGSKSNVYGIHAAGADAGRQGISIGALSSDFEVEYVEVSNTGFSGIMAKTEPGCSDTDPNSFRGGFIQRNGEVHDNFIHDVKGEGIYFGYSFPNGRDITCAGVITRVYSHPLENMHIYDNVFDRSGCEAIQVGLGKNTRIHNNYVKDYGQDPFASYQNNGIQLGGGSGGDIYNNFIINTNTTREVGNGLILIGKDDTRVFNNLIVNPSSGMYIHKDASLGKDMLIANNTIVSPVGFPSLTKNGSGIWSFNGGANIKIINNVIVLEAPNDSLTMSAHVAKHGIYNQQSTWPITVQNNFVYAPSELNAVFVSPAAKDYRLKSDLSAVTVSEITSLPALTVNHAISEAGNSASSGSRKLAGALEE